MKTILEEYLPQQYYAYKDVKEYRNICRTLDREHDRLKRLAVNLLKGVYFRGLNEQWLKAYEEILEITPKANDTLETRRLRVIARFNMVEPFDEVYLANFLEAVLGSDGFEIDYDVLVDGECHIYIRTQDSTLFWMVYEELLLIIPMNLTISITQIFETPETQAPLRLYGAVECGAVLEVYSEDPRK